jgi:hypothetical protein
LGKDEIRPANQTLAEAVVTRLLEPIRCKGRNVTTDNFFTSLSLAKQLKEKHVSLIGTMRTNRRELPTLVTSTSNPLYSSTVMKSDDATLTAYHCKKHKNVMKLSTMHQSVGIAANEKKTPETIQFYNETKFDVDVFDQMTRKYSVKASVLLTLCVYLEPFSSYSHFLLPIYRVT